MVQYSNLDRVVEARDHFKNVASSNSLTSKENFFVKHKGFFIIGLTSLVLMLILYYLDEGIHKLPNSLTGYFEVVMGSIWFSVIPVSIFLLTGLSKKLKRYRLVFSFLGFLPIFFIIYMFLK